MAERDLSESVAPQPLEPDRWIRDKERLEEQLELLKSDPSALTRLRDDAQGCAVLMSLTKHSDRQGDRNLATTYLANAFRGEPGVRAFLFNRLRDLARTDGDAALYAILANHADDDSAIQELVAIFSELTPGEIAVLLRKCFRFSPPVGVLNTTHEPYRPMGVSEEAWEDWNIAIRSATLRLLPHPDLHALLLDLSRRDPDGPVEAALLAILPPLIGTTPKPPIRIAWRIKDTWDEDTIQRQVRTWLPESHGKVLRYGDPVRRARALRTEGVMDDMWRRRQARGTPPSREQSRGGYYMDPSPEQLAAWAGLTDIARDLFEKLAALHPKWPRIDDYIEEFDSVAKRRIPGWQRAQFMFDNDLEHRQSRVAFRMSQFPDAITVRRAFETMLFDRPPLYPKVRDEQDYFQFEPLGWRCVAWAALTSLHWTVDEALEFTRIIVESGPWDAEARKSKEAIEAVVRTWPTAESVMEFLAECKGREDVGAFVRDDIARIRSEAQAGKAIRLDRYWGKGYRQPI